MTIQKCSACSLKQEETWPSQYKREIGTRNPKPFLCRDCKKIKFLFDNPHIVAERDKKRIAKELKQAAKKLIKSEIHRFNDFAKNNSEASKYLEEIKQKNRNNSRQYFATEKGREAYQKGLAKRKMNVLNSLIDLSDQERKDIRKFYKECPENYTVDHIIPVSKGGKHCLKNLQYLTDFENRHKKDKIRFAYLKDFLKPDQSLSITFLQRKFKLTFDEAKKIYDEIEYYKDCNVYFEKRILIKIREPAISKPKIKKVYYGPKKIPKYRRLKRIKRIE